MPARPARPVTTPAGPRGRAWQALFAPLYATDPPEPAKLLQALRLVYLVVFLFQVLLAVLLTLALAAWLPSPPRPNTVLAAVLFTFAALQLPIGLLLPLQLFRRANRGAALAGVTVAAVVLSSSAWFTALMLLSGQRPPWLLASGSLLMLAYAAGILLTPRATRAALTPSPQPAAGPPASA